MSVPVKNGKDFASEQARQLLPARYLSSISERIYDVSPDGQRFLMLYAGGGRIVVVQDWLEELKQRLPVH
jgi:hypothetical protein